jgi:hypothetical protein
VTDGPDYRDLVWAQGSLTVQRLGAMLAPVTFVLADGRQVAPMHIAPWAGTPAEAGLPGILKRLRGEWPCVPFGYTIDDPTAPPDWARLNGTAAPDEEIHGHSSNSDWTWIKDNGESLALEIEYPAQSPIRRLRRVVTPDPIAAAVDLSLTIEVKQACRLPLGLHPTFRLPTVAGGARIEPDPFVSGRTFPGTVEPSAPLFAIDAEFESLASVPLRVGGRGDATHVPFADDTEDLLQLNGLGRVSLANLDERYRVTLSWDQSVYPSLLLWYSNRGRKGAPWNGRHVALGMEPICSPFGLGPNSAAADNPLARSGLSTARDFTDGEILTTRYRIEVNPL